MNYILNGIQALKESFLWGILIFIAVIGLQYLFKKRKSITWKCIFEAIFCVYCVTLLKLTGIFTLRYNLSSLLNPSYSLLPFVGSSFVPILLNFALFLPLGFFLPLLFSSCKGNWKKVTVICCLTSLAIELLQLFGGRYAELEDLLVNTLGGFSGCVVYTCITEAKGTPKKAVRSLIFLCLALAVCFLGIYAVGDHHKETPDGLSAVEENIADVTIYWNGEKRNIGTDSYIYRSFSSQIYNCGGHMLEIQEIAEDKIQMDTGCFLEVRYTAPQTIRFENAENFSIENADRLLYDADQNILYWGDAGYRHCLDYTRLDEPLAPYREDILKSYEELAASIRDSFSK